MARPKEELLRTGAVMRWLDITARQLRLYCETGLLHPIRPRPSSHRQYRRSEIEKVILGETP